MAESSSNNKLYAHELTLDTDPPMFVNKINSNSNPGLFKQFFVRDSMIDYFPYMQFTINDDAGVFIEDSFFTEGLKWKMQWQIVNDQSGAMLEHDFYWSEHQIPQSWSPDIMVGDVIFPMLSHFDYQDAKKSQSWQMNISDIVSQLINNYTFPGTGSPSKKIFITKTVNQDTWYQANQTDAFLIDDIFSRYAYNPAYSKSPWFSWINLRGEFHFEPLVKIFQGASKGNFYYGKEQKDFNNVFLTSQNYDVIHNFSIIMLGAPTNKENYNRDFYSLDDSATFKKDNFQLPQKLDPLGTNVFNLRKDYLKNKRSVDEFGIIDETAQQNMYQGWVNSQFINSTSFPFRLKILTNFRPDIVAGDVIDTTITSSIDEKNFIAQEFSGKWVVIESAHAINEKGDAGSSFTIGKSTINMFNKHKFVKEFKAASAG